MTELRKIGLSLAMMFGLAFGASGVAMASSTTPTSAGYASVVQYGDEDTEVDCTRTPEHPNCPQQPPQ